MNRREILAWLSRGMSAAMTAMIGIPGLRFLSGGVVSHSSSQTSFQRLKRVQDLPIGAPVLVPVLGSKRDAWVQSDQQVIGRVWLIRRDPSVAASAGDEPEVHAFNSTCPHMGCQIQEQNSHKGFICPCHKATFSLNGQRQVDAVTQERNHAPRDMDDLQCRVVKDPATGDSWVEVKYQSFEVGSVQRIVRS